MDVLSKDYNWQMAVQSSTQSRERTFLLLDVSAIVKLHFHLQKIDANCAPAIQGTTQLRSQTVGAAGVTQSRATNQL